MSLLLFHPQVTKHHSAAWANTDLDQSTWKMSCQKAQYLSKTPSFYPHQEKRKHSGRKTTESPQKDTLLKFETFDSHSVPSLRRKYITYMKYRASKTKTLTEQQKDSSSTERLDKKLYAKYRAYPTFPLCHRTKEAALRYRAKRLGASSPETERG